MFHDKAEYITYQSAKSIKVGNFWNFSQDFTEDPEGTIRKVYEFLSLDPGIPLPDLHKVMPEDVMDYLQVEKQSFQTDFTKEEQTLLEDYYSAPRRKKRFDHFLELLKPIEGMALCLILACIGAFNPHSMCISDCAILKSLSTIISKVYTEEHVGFVNTAFGS